MFFFCCCTENNFQRHFAFDVLITNKQTNKGNKEQKKYKATKANEKLYIGRERERERERDKNATTAISAIAQKLTAVHACMSACAQFFLPK